MAHFRMNRAQREELISLNASTASSGHKNVEQRETVALGRLDTPLSRSSQHLEAATEAMDQHREEDNSKESTDRHEVEEDTEESVDQRKGDEENNSEELTGQRKQEESSEEAIAASSLFAHPCSLLQYIVRVCACCMGFRDSFSDPKPSAESDAPAAPANSSQEGEEEDKTPREVTPHALEARTKPREPDNPKEGSGGHGGQHN